MADPCATPTLFQKLIRTDFSESTKRWTLILVALTLASAVLWIGGCIGYRTIAAGDVGSGAVAAFMAVTVPLAALAGNAYRKPEANP
jgi:predicted permease